MKKPTIADTVIEVLKDNDCNGIMWGDCFLLDEVADRLRKTHNLMNLHPLTRHVRILNALEKDKRFKKHLVDLSGAYRGCSVGRCFKLNNYGVIMWFKMKPEKTTLLRDMIIKKHGKVRFDINADILNKSRRWSEWLKNISQSKPQSKT